MQKEQQELANLIKGKKVAFIGAGVSHKTLIKEFVELGAHVTLCDQKKSVEDFGDYAATLFLQIEEHRHLLRVVIFKCSTLNDRHFDGLSVLWFIASLHAEGSNT